MIAWLAMVGCGPSLPEWLPGLSPGPFEVVDASEVRFSANPAEVEDSLHDAGWVSWRVTDESVVDSHHTRVERNGVWADLRSTEQGSRLLKLDAPPQAHPISPVEVPGLLSEPAKQLPLAQLCQRDGADYRFTPGHYLASSGRAQRAGTWSVEGRVLTLSGAEALRCEGLVVVGEVTPKLISCGPDPLFWCGTPSAPVTAVVDAGAGARQLSLVAAVAGAEGDFVYRGSAAESAGITVLIGSDDSRERAEAVGYRIHRDLGVPVRFEDDPAGPAAVVIRVGKPVTSGTR